MKRHHFDNELKEKNEKIKELFAALEKINVILTRYSDKEVDFVTHLSNLLNSANEANNVCIQILTKGNEKPKS